MSFPSQHPLVLNYADLNCSRPGNCSATAASSACRKSLNTSRARDFCTSFPNGEWKRTASNESTVTGPPPAETARRCQATKHAKLKHNLGFATKIYGRDRLRNNTKQTMCWVWLKHNLFAWIMRKDSVGIPGNTTKLSRYDNVRDSVRHNTKHAWYCPF